MTQTSNLPALAELLCLVEENKELRGEKKREEWPVLTL